MNSQEYIEVSIRIRPFSEENAEILIAELNELPFESFTEEDPYLKCYIQKELYSAQMLKVILSGLDICEFEANEFNARLIPPVNWNAQWESQFDPIVIDRKCTIKAPFHKDLPKTRFNITIEPHMAFGTGHHQTTYMMCRALLANESSIKGKTVLDMGCGTAVLGILAAKLGALKVYGIDIDAVAATSAFDNAHRNRVGRKVETYCGDASLLQMGKYDVILANINRNILIQDMAVYSRSLKRSGLLFVSGFYTADKDAVSECAQKYGLQMIAEESIEDWCCLEFSKPTQPLSQNI